MIESETKELDKRSIDLIASGCDCPEGVCMCFCEPASICVNRLARQGLVHTYECNVCEGVTWHLNGVCLKCQHIERNN